MIDSCRKFSTKLRKAPHLPHQVVREGRNAFARSFGIFPGSYFAGLGAVAQMYRDDGSPQTTFTNLLKTNFLDPKPLATTNSQIQNSSPNQSSHHVTVAAKSRPDITPAGLSVAALNINLSSLGPLYSSAVHRDTNSSNRVSRAASPSLGNSAENNRLHIGRILLICDLSRSVCFHPRVFDPCALSYHSLNFWV